MKGLPDLHRHLDGSVRPSTLTELAAADGVVVPPDLPFRPGMGLAAALSKFAFILSLLQQPERVRRVAREVCDDAAEEGVTTLEVRFAPQLHRGAPPEEIVDAALEGLGGRAGLILCGLYGEPPAVLEHLVEIAASRKGVVGIDLAGGPAPGAKLDFEVHARAYRRAEELGIGRTVHASEGRPPREIAVAIESLRAQRLGHATTLLEDDAVLDLVLARGVVIEACPTSNHHTGAVSPEIPHPVAAWLVLGVRACVNSDNTLLSATDARREHELLSAIPGVTARLCRRAIEVGHSAAFQR